MFKALIPLFLASSFPFFGGCFLGCATDSFFTDVSSFLGVTCFSVETSGTGFLSLFWSESFSVIFSFTVSTGTLSCFGTEVSVMGGLMLLLTISDFASEVAGVGFN